jgi:hypothetical protein
MIQNNFFGSIIRRLYKMQPFYIYIYIYIYYNKEKFCQTYEISKEWGCLIAAVAASPQHPMSITREGGNL